MATEEFINVEFLEMLFHGIVAFLAILFVIVFTYVLINHFTKKKKKDENE